MKEGNVTLSTMDCYAGKWRCEVSAFEPAIHDEGPGLYIQFVEGCGYNVFTLTPEEAEQIAAALLQGAKDTRRFYEAVPKERLGDINLIHEPWYEELTK